MLARRSNDRVDGEERGSGRDFLCRDEGDADELAFPKDARLGESGAGGLIIGRFGGDEDVGEAGVRE